MFSSSSQPKRLKRPLDGFIPNPKLRLEEQCREVMRFKRFSIRTEQTYWDWIKRFILFHGKRHPREMGELEVTAFLTHLAAQRNVAASTQNQALSALLFLYRDVLKVQLDWVDGFERANRPPRVPVVLSKSEVQRVLAAVPSKYLLFCRLLYGTGLRLMEGLRLRVKDADFERRQILVRDGKGFKDRVTMLPESLAEPLRAHLIRVKPSTREIWRRASERCCFPSRWRRSIQTPSASGPGNGFSPAR